MFERIAWRIRHGLDLRSTLNELDIIRSGDEAVLGLHRGFSDMLMQSDLPEPRQGSGSLHKGVHSGRI